jgi:hypothetical protein
MGSPRSAALRAARCFVSSRSFSSLACAVAHAHALFCYICRQGEW